MSKPTKPARCGTHSGWARHNYLDEEPCDACKRAKAEYDRRRRDAGDNTLRNRLHAKAQRWALQTLARRYPDEYSALYAAKKARLYEEEGLTHRWDRATHVPEALP